VEVPDRLAIVPKIRVPVIYQDFFALQIFHMCPYEVLEYGVVVDADYANRTHWLYASSVE
jgi:hypothetical protein